MVRVLVLGANEYLGSTICQALRRSGHTVYGVSQQNKCLAPGHFDLRKDEVIQIPYDKDRSPYMKAIDNGSVDVVVYDSGQTPNRSDDEQLLKKLKSAGRGRVKNSVGKSPKQGFLYLSKIWDLKLDWFPNDENKTGLVMRPSSADGWLPKFEKEIINARSVLDTLIIRPAVIYGRDSSYWTSWLYRLSESKKRNMLCYGCASIPLVHIDDVASATTLAVEQISKFGAGSSIYPVLDLVTSREPLELILQRVASSLGYRGDIEFSNEGLAEEHINGRLSSTRMRDLLGWVSRREFGMLDEIDLVIEAWKAYHGGD